MSLVFERFGYFVFICASVLPNGSSFVVVVVVVVVVDVVVPGPPTAGFFSG